MVHEAPLILKYPGNKRSLVPSIAPWLLPVLRAYPDQTLVEPFCGSCAVSLHVRLSLPSRLILRDVNPHVINLLNCIRDNWERVYQFTEWEKPDHFTEADYYTMRAEMNYRTTAIPEKRAAWFMILNRTGFNGLVRFTRKGKYNVPWGDRQPSLPSYDEFQQMFSLLQGAMIEASPFTDPVPRNSIIYADPPYLKDERSSFKSYWGNFGREETIKLSRWHSRPVLMSNADSNIINQIFCPPKWHKVWHGKVFESIGPTGKERGQRREALFANRRMKEMIDVYC